jgi:hypothetical protein
MTTCSVGLTKMNWLKAPLADTAVLHSAAGSRSRPGYPGGSPVRLEVAILLSLVMPMPTANRRASHI